MIDNLSDMIDGEDNDVDRKTLIDQQEACEQLRDQLMRQANALHRQEVLDRAAIPDDELDSEAEEQLTLEMQKQMDKDMGERIRELAPEVQRRVDGLWTRMKARMKDFNQTSAIPRDELLKAFEDLEGEIVQHSELAKVWRQRSVSWTMQRNDEETQLE